MSAHQEHQLQTACATYLARALPSNATWCSVDNATGQRLDPIAGARRKARGCRPGFPDMLVIYCGMFTGIELKTASGTVSDAQRRMSAEIIAAGAQYHICRSVEDVEAALRHDGVPLRAVTMAAATYDERLTERALAPKKAGKPRARPVGKGMAAAWAAVTRPPSAR